MRKAFGQLQVGERFRFPSDTDRDDIDQGAIYTVVAPKEGSTHNDARVSNSRPRISVGSEVMVEPIT